MKKFISVFVIIASLASCDVTLDPPTFRSISYTDEAQLDEQVAGMYNILEQDGLYGQGLWGYLTAGVDESFRRDASQALQFPQFYNITNTDQRSLLLWRNLYKGIENANIILDVVNKPPIDENKRSRIRGEAMFLRAYYFYLLVSYFGDAPLKIMLSTELGTNFQLSRDPSKAIYDFVIQEMEAAYGLVPSDKASAGTTRVTQSAVAGILARVCLSMAGNPINDPSKYEAALHWAEVVIHSGTHALNISAHNQYPNTPAYAKRFINNMQNVTNDATDLEGIWDAAFLSKSNSSGNYTGTNYLVTQQLGAVMGIHCPDASPAAIIGYSPGTYRVQPALYNLYGPGDLRRDWAAAPYVYKDASTDRYPILDVSITGGGGAGAKATAFTNANGTISAVVIDDPGSGYTAAPEVQFIGYFTNTAMTPAGAAPNTATAAATVSGGHVTAIEIIGGGLGYPTVYERCVGKWRREYETNLPPVRTQNNTSCNFPIVRYADVLLMAAEADMLVNGGPSPTAVDYFNQVRRRAYGRDPLTAAPELDVATFSMQDIMDERARELCFEGLRRNDLIRWGKMQEVQQHVITVNGNNAPSAYQLTSSLAATNYLSNPMKYNLLPIPAEERFLDRALTQNPGWE